jgi:UDP-glucuronate 4-epimerase
MSKILVTGAAGFIGSHLCETLVGRGDEVIGLDNLDEFYDPAVKRRNLVALSGNEAFQFVQGDIRDRTLVERLLARGIEVVMHLAARAGVRPSIEQPLLYQDVNINGTMVLLEACRELGVKRFIFSSSSSVYGNNEKVPFSESDNVDFPISPYAATKKAGELICHTYHHLYGLDLTCLRFFTVYGPRQRPDLAIHKFARLIEAGRPIPVFGDGTMMRDFTYIDDIIDGVVRAIDCCKGYHIYNLGESQPVALADLITMLEEALGKKAIIERMPLQPGDVNRTFADVSLAGRDLGYRPTTSLRLGLQKFVGWLRDESEGC